jgi:hexokinase
MIFQIPFLSQLNLVQSSASDRTNPQLISSPSDLSLQSDLPFQAELNEYFPEITFANQIEIFDQYTKLISDEEIELKSFNKSLIDTEVICNFNESMKGKGDYLVFSIDFGGSSLKISTVKISFLPNKEIPIFESQNETIFKYKNENLKEISGMRWYEWVAEKLKNYLKTYHEINDQILSAAFTFSFPLIQDKLNSGKVVGTNKDFYFSREDFAGSDAVKCLNEELARKNIKIKINCVLNDVVASLTAGIGMGINDPISLIVGTGTNAGFSLNSTSLENKGKQIINSEMAAFPIKDAFLDKSVKEILKQKSETKYSALEITVAGMKYVEIIEIALKEFKVSTSDVTCDLDFIKGEITRNNLNERESLRTNLIKRIHKKIKQRAYRLLAAIMVAVSKGESFNLITNGSIVTLEEDSKILEEEINLFLGKKFGTGKTVTIINDNSASLHGAAFVSLAYSELEQKK